MFQIGIELNPTLSSTSRQLHSAAEDSIADVFKTIADYAPEEMRSLMDSASRSGDTAKREKSGNAFSRSAEGEVPAKDSFALYDSIRAEAVGKTVVLRLAEHAKFLDPVFGEDEYLNRPFIEKGLENAVSRLERL